MRSSIFIILSIIALASATQYVPIPNKPDGVGFGNINATLTIDAWYDLTCPDSLNTYQELLTALNNQTIAAYVNQIRINYHIMPLPYHYNAFYLAQVFKYVLEVKGSEAALVYVDQIFENQYLYYNAFNLTTTQIYQLIADNTSQYLSAYNVTSQEVLDSFNDYDYNGGARASYKLGSGLTVTGTPTIFANDAFVNDGQDLNASGWVDLILSVFDPQPDEELISSY
ncbi:hypothetical protein ABPG72_002671 [Tetrahymena utriculariae]